MTTAPPHNKEAEKALLSCMINYPNEDYSQIEWDDFYIASYWVLAWDIIDLKSSKEDINLLSIYEKVKIKWITIPQITELAEYDKWTRAAIPSLISTIKNYRRRRLQIELAREMEELSTWTTEEIIAYAEKLKEVAKIGSSASSSMCFSDVNNAYELIQERMGKKVYWYSWGSHFEFLDNATKWLIKKMVYRIGAPSWVGKTQFIYTLIPELLKQNNPDGSKVKVVFFTLENTKESTLTSIMCKAQWINQFKLTEWMVEGNWQYLVDLGEQLHIIDDLYDIGDIFSKIRQIKPDIVILDYIGYVNIKGFTDEAKYTEYAKRVVRFTKEENLCWIDLSNLANDTQTNDEIRIKPKFYWSSFLVNNSDVNIMIMRNEVYSDARNYVYKNKTLFRPEDIKYFASRDIVDMVVTKNRWGPPRVETTYGVNQDNWWNHRELPQTDLDSLRVKYGW